MVDRSINGQTKYIVDSSQKIIPNFLIDKKISPFNIIYGGSVNAKNSKDIINLSEVDGALIGGASLKIEDFNKIIAWLIAWFIVLNKYKTLKWLLLLSFS